MGDFHGFLDRLVDDLEEPAKRDQERSLSSIGRYVSTLIHPIEWVKDSEERELDQNLVCAARASTTLDAVEWLRLHANVLSLRPKWIHDFTKGRRDPKEFLEAFPSEQLPRSKNFAYVAWSERTSARDRVQYIGKACSESRLNFHKHSSLVAAMSTASTLSIVLPAINSETAAFATEAALLHIVTEAEGKPRYNVRTERLKEEPHEHGRKHLRETSREFEKLALALRRHAEA